MEQKVQELTKRIFEEGVQKGEARAEELIAAAVQRSEQQLAEARLQAQRIVEDAHREAAELKRAAEAEIKLAGEQALAAVKLQLLDVIDTKVVTEPVHAVLSDATVIKELLLAVVNVWKSTAEDASLDVLLPAQQQAELEKALHGAVQKMLGSGITLTYVKGIKAGFQIGPHNDRFKISLTDKDFAEYIKAFLRPKTRAYLFGE
jgi:V/A-type H+-transporting ATPase subunit E